MAVTEYQDYIVRHDETLSEEIVQIQALSDSSGSGNEIIEGKPRIDTVNSFASRLVSKLASDSEVDRLTKLSVCTFNEGFDVVQDWETPSKIGLPRFTARGGTDIHGALSQAIERTRDAAHAVEQAGGRVKIPHIVLISDLWGWVGDDLIAEIRKREKTDRLRLWVFAEPGYNPELAEKLAPTRTFTSEATFEQGLEQFADMMFKITKAISMSAPGEAPQLNENPLDRPDNVLSLVDFNKLL